MFLGRLISSMQVEGLKALMGLFLKRAVPALNTQYTAFSRQEGVASFLLLLEMCGWAFTWDPDAASPINMLQVSCIADVRAQEALFSKRQVDELVGDQL
jgi:hypothetical protein